MNENLNKKLLALQKSVRALAKNADGFGYQYVSGSKLLYFIRPLMDELGLRLVPDTVSVRQEIVKTAEGDESKGKPAKYETLVILNKTFTWVDVETGESETTNFSAQGCNGWDKSIGSAETYAERYFLLKYFHIATDEDDVDALQPKEQPVAQKAETKKAGKKKAAEVKESAEATEAAEAVEAAAVQTEDSLVADTEEKAIALAKDAKDSKSLVAIWNANKDKFGFSPGFVMAVTKNPHNPKKR